MHMSWRVARRTAGILVALAVTVAGPAAAQGSLVSDLPESAPTEAQYRLGPVILEPSMALPAIGVDTNVFDDATDPKQDWMATLAPDITFFVQPGMLQFVAKSGSTFTYYNKYHSERSISQDLRARLGIRLSRFKPWVGVASVQSADRPTPEIDTRAKRNAREVSAGIAFQLTPLADVTGYAARVDTRFNAGEQFREVDLASALDRRGETAGIGLRIRATPFTTIELRGTVARDQFVNAPQRDSRSTAAEINLSFSPEAIIRGTARLGYEDYRPESPDVKAFRGLTTEVGLTAVGYWRGVLTVRGTRGVEYSYDAADQYYVETGVDVTYTQRIGGPWDLQARGARSWLAYDASRPGGRNDDLHSYQAGIGFNLQNNSRIGLNYEYAERRSAERADQRFTRRRIFGSYSFEFWK